MKKNYIFAWLFLVILLTSCSVPRVDHIPIRANSPRHLAVFFDGTNNEESSHTNVKKLHNLVSLQERDNISSTYIRGVGTGFRVIGMGVGWGIGHDVRDAYQYLAENYHKGDEISLYGFSRGAFSARILATMLYVSGLPDLYEIEPSDRESFVDEIYDAYKQETLSLCERRKKVSEVYNIYELKNIAIFECDKNSQSLINYPLPVNIRFMGLWDTVEALGWPDKDYSPGETNTRYADQLCNVQNVAHALSLDDNRARIFTPKLLSQRHILEQTCDKPKNFSTVLNEVWFSGAHSDVGGGNGTDISGVSLNWMLDMMEVAQLKLINRDTSVYSNYLAKTHEGDSGIPALAYKKVNRDLKMYTQHPDYKSFFEINNESANNKNNFVSLYDKEGSSMTLRAELKIHQSVLDRLCVIPSKNFESQWYKDEPYRGCIKCDKNKGYIKNTEDCKKEVKVVGNTRYKSFDSSMLDNTCDQAACWLAKGESYSLIKSCNYNNSSTTNYASERLEVRDLAKTGDKAIITFYSDRDEDHTGVYLKGGVSYRISIHGSGIEGWKDCNYSANIEDGRAILSSDKPFFLTLGDIVAFPFAHSYNMGYMGLLGQIDGKNYPIGKLAINGQIFIPSNNGELVLRVNEPQFFNSVYKNNHGRVELLIEALDL